MMGAGGSTMDNQKVTANIEKNLLEEKAYRAMLHTLPGIGSVRIRQLIERFGSAVKACAELESSGSGEQWWQKLKLMLKEADPFEIYANLQAQGIGIVIPEEDGYPELLRHLADAPPLLYYKGTLTDKREALAIVGSRKATPYGRAAAESLAKESAREGIVIVSGLARGIDSAAHRGALTGGGITWAVMGCGLKFIYPPENQKLATEIIEKGGALWSEYPPETPPAPQLFPARNRLISGMSRGVVVVEAALKSGALITVDFALEQGREVFAVPGPIFSQMSKGPNQLIRQGAKLVESYEDICSEIPGFARAIPLSPATEKDNNAIDRVDGNMNTEKESDPQSQEILNLLSDLPMHIDEITQKAKVAPEQLPLILLELQLAGRIQQLPGQFYVLTYKC